MATYFVQKLLYRVWCSYVRCRGCIWI